MDYPLKYSCVTQKKTKTKTETKTKQKKNKKTLNVIKMRAP